MAGISSRALSNVPANRKKFNGNEEQREEFNDGNGLEWLDFNARTYDAQTGRFLQIDPEVEIYQEHLSPYHFASNNPILYGDPDGKNPFTNFLKAAVQYTIGRAQGIVNSTVAVGAPALRSVP